MVYTETICDVLGNSMQTRAGCTSKKLRPVVAGYRMDSFRRLSGPITNTARAVRGIPAISFSSGSSIPYLQSMHILTSLVGGRTRTSK